MPRRVIDYEALWASDKIAACAEWAQAEYAWCYGLADANGSFELTNLRVVYARVAAVRKNLPFERFEEIIGEFHAHGLLFIWTAGGKRYGHWTGSDKPGRLPRESRRTARYGPILAPPVPKKALEAYVAGFENRPSGPSDSEVKTEYQDVDCDTTPVDGKGLGLGLGKGVVVKQQPPCHPACELWELLEIDPSKLPAAFRELCEGLFATKGNQSLGELMGFCMNLWEEQRKRIPPPFAQKAREIRAREKTPKKATSERPELESIPWNKK
jgi:hypothetical protein